MNKVFNKKVLFFVILFMCLISLTYVVVNSGINNSKLKALISKINPLNSPQPVNKPDIEDDIKANKEVGIIEPSSNPNKEFGFVESKANENLSDWYPGNPDPAELNENYVFHSLIKHTGKGQNWTIKIGKGGQIYSIKTPELGELIAMQRYDAGQWVDEVFQNTIPMLPQKEKGKYSEVVDGDIHQAGFYSKSDLKDYDKNFLPSHSIYSPLFCYRYGKDLNQVRYITWPQHAHLPRLVEDERYNQNQLLLYETIKDLGDGVIQIDVEYAKWGGNTNEILISPKSTFRHATVPVQLISKPDNSYVSEFHNFSDDVRYPRLNEDTIGGWFALAKDNKPEAMGVGIVFGRINTPEAAGIFRWGTYGSGNDDNALLRGTSIFVMRNAISLKKGETVYSRYFIVLGTVSQIQKHAKELESQVIFKKINRQMSAAGEAAAYLDRNGNLASRPTSDNQKPIFKAFRRHITESMPLFLVQNKKTKDFDVTSNPYSLGYSAQVNFDPTKSQVEYIDFLGWALPQSIAKDANLYETVENAIKSTKLPIHVSRELKSLKVWRLK